MLSTPRPRVCSGQPLSTQLGVCGVRFRLRAEEQALWERPTACVPSQATKNRGTVKALVLVCRGHVFSFLSLACNGPCPSHTLSQPEPDVLHIWPALGKVSVCPRHTRGMCWVSSRGLLGPVSPTTGAVTALLLLDVPSVCRQPVLARPQDHRGRGHTRAPQCCLRVRARGYPLHSHRSLT